MTISQLEWIDGLSNDLKARITEFVQKDPSLIPLFADLHDFWNANKRQKVEMPVSNDKVKYLTNFNLQLSDPLVEDEIIFEIPLISFQSPIRRKMNMVLHLISENGVNPILSIVNPQTNIPEISLTKLSSLVKLCMMLPILGMSNLPNKKNIGSFCFWLNQEAFIDGKPDPIICQVNLDLLKKHLIKTGKIPSNIEAQFANNAETGDGIKPINEAIIQFLTRQFKLCGINLINYLPSSIANQNTLKLNEDTGISLSHKNNLVADMLLIEAYKGAKDGALLLTNRNQFNSSYLIFGFKKPILVYNMDEIANISYSDITRVTFSLNITLKNDKVLEFSMIDQKYHSMIDDFMKLQGINDKSFDDSLKEKQTKSSDNNNGENGNGGIQNTGALNDDDDDEEDDNYQGGEEEEDVAEEFDSNAGSDSDSDDENANANANPNASGDDITQLGKEETVQINET